MTQTRSILRLVGLSLSAAALAASGCGVSSSSGIAAASGGAAQPVAAEAFVDSDPQVPGKDLPSAAAPASSRSAARRTPPPSPPSPPGPASTEPADTTLTTASVVGTPTPAANSVPASNQLLILESLVGQVNGRPVFASEILEPLDAQLRAMSQDRKKDRAVFIAESSKLINDELLRVIRDELVLAEARASLTPEQKQGVLYFLNRIQEDLVSQQRGSAVAADEEARAAFGGSLRARAQDRLDQELVSYEFNQRINPRVQVPWRQTQLEYEKNLDKFNPKPVAVYRIIQVRTRDTEAAARVTQELSSGRAFEEIAKSEVNLLGAGKGGLMEPIALTGEPDQALVGGPELSNAARRLAVGEYAGPINDRDRTMWVMLESVEQSPPIPLYEAQLDIEYELRQKRRSQETIRYFEKLSRRGNVSKLEDMLLRLRQIAEQRYPAPPPTKR